MSKLEWQRAGMWTSNNKKREVNTGQRAKVRTHKLKVEGRSLKVKGPLSKDKGWRSNFASRRSEAKVKGQTSQVKCHRSKATNSCVVLSKLRIKNLRSKVEGPRPKVGG